MSKRKNPLPFDKRGGVVAIQSRLMRSRRYLGLSPQAKVLLHLMQVHWRNFEPVAYGVREAEHKIPCSRKTAMRAFKDLQEAGFIRLVDQSLFCSRAQSKTRTWRLTWLPYNSKAPTNDWDKPIEN